MDYFYMWDMAVQRDPSNMPWSLPNNMGPVWTTSNSLETTDKTGLVRTIELEYPDSDSNISYDDTNRSAFIRKVYGVLTVNTLFATGIVVMCLMVSQLWRFFEEYTTIYIALFICTIFLAFLVGYCQPLQKSWFNYIITVVCVICFGFLIGGDHYETRDSINTTGTVATLGVCISVLACQRQWDITNYASVIRTLDHFLIWFLLLVLIRSKIAIIFMIFDALVLLFYCVKFFLHTQMILGDGKLSYSPQQYVRAALMVFLDVGIMFVLTRALFDIVLGDF